MNIVLPDIHADGGDLAFLLGVLFNQRVRGEVAWQSPARLHERLGCIDPWHLAAIDRDELAAVILQAPSLHPWATVMARNVVGTCAVLVRDYDGQARNLWSDQPTGQLLVTRFSALPGIGRHKARVAIALLSLEYGLTIGGDGAQLAAEALASCPRLSEVIRPHGLAAVTERTHDAATDSPLRR
jgi:uncharacterized HhH-GPD family protein